MNGLNQPSVLSLTARCDLNISDYVRWCKEILEESNIQERSILQRQNNFLLSGIEEVTSAPNHTRTAAHNLYKGIDFPLEYDFYDDVHVSSVEGYCTGNYEIYVLHASSQFKVYKPTARFRLPTTGPQTYVRSSCLKGFDQCCHGSVIAVSRKDGDGNWTPLTLGVIDGISYFSGDDCKQHRITFYESVGHTLDDGSPAIVHCKDWISMEKHVKKYRLSLDEVEFFFINLVRFIIEQIGYG